MYTSESPVGVLTDLIDPLASNLIENDSDTDTDIRILARILPRFLTEPAQGVRHAETYTLAV